MKLYSENENYKLYHGNMLDMSEVIEPNSIDSIITDPPYELNFMNKGWDNSGIAFQPDTWKKCYEVLKPGGHLLAFGGSRTFHRIACAIEDAGFEIRDTIMWLYGSGFPKSMDISKSLDKRNGKQNEDFTKFGNYVKRCREAKGYSKNDIDKIMGTNTACAWWEGRMYKDDFIVQLPDKENYYKLKEVLDMNDDYDYLIEWQEAEREVIGKKESGCFNGQEKDRYTIGSSKSLEVDITIPSTDLAKQWQGWGTALKPSFEPIIVARKPFKGSLVDNVIEYGVGGINIDECRVGNEERTQFSGRSQSKSTVYNSYNQDNAHYETVQGRFPANTILTYDESDFDEVCGGFPNTKSQKPRNVSNEYTSAIYGKYAERQENCIYNDSGSASRYFYCAKASKKDRDEGLENFIATTDKAKGNGLDRICEFCGVSQLTPELCHCEVKSWITKPRKNTHPTVKPTSLMQYLVRLVTPNGGIVLDPFNGSGSTGKAVMYENKERNKGYKYIGIELTEEYLPISKARIEYVSALPQEDKQTTIFDYIGEDNE